MPPTPELLQRVLAEVQGLADEQVRQVLDFIDALKNRLSPPGSAAPDCIHRSGHFAWYTRLPREGVAWAFDYLEALLARLMAELRVDPPSSVIRVELHAAEAPVVLGEARPDSLVFWRGGGTFLPDSWSRWIFAHELCNLMVVLSASPGMPKDWWANRSSPFPLAASTELMQALGFADDAHQILAAYERDSLVRMFRRLLEDLGWPWLARAFALMRDDQMVWVRFPNPSELLSHYICAYLQAAAGCDLSLYLALGGVGSKPPQWDEFHPGQPFAAYTIDRARLEQIWRARTALQTLADPAGEAAARAWQAYRTGRYELVSVCLEGGDA